MRWVSEISDALVNSQHICVSHEFLAVLDTLIELGYVQESTTALSVCACLKAVLNNMAQCPSMSLKRCVDLCLFRLTDTSIKVRNGYLTLLKVIPINVTTRLVHKIPLPILIWVLVLTGLFSSLHSTEYCHCCKDYLCSRFRETVFVYQRSSYLLFDFDRE